MQIPRILPTTLSPFCFKSNTGAATLEMLPLQRIKYCHSLKNSAMAENTAYF